MTEKIINRKIQKLMMYLQSFSNRNGLLPEQVALLQNILLGLPLLVEELRMAGEELQQQNEELLASQQAQVQERRLYQELFELVPDGYLVTDSHGLILEANRAATVLLQMGVDPLVGKPVSVFLAQEDLKAFYAFMGRCKQEQENHEWEVFLKPKKGTPFLAAITVAAQRDAQNNLVGLRWLLRYITAFRPAAQENLAPPFNILLVDAHVMFRRGIRNIIEDIKDVEVIGEASDGFELMELLKKNSPNLIIMDISMPNLRGLEAIREIKIINPAIKVLILSIHKEEDYLNQALAAGATGYLLKECDESELLSAINTLRRGGTYITPLLTAHMVDQFRQKSQPGVEPQNSTMELLTCREREIVKLIAEGKSSKKVAELLFISPRTVQHHRLNIMTKLNIKKTTELVKYAIKKDYTT